MNEYPISSFALLFPPMLDEEFDNLVNSIKENGLLEPIALWHGKIIDGRHRYEACKETGVECRFVELEEDIDPIAYIIAKNDIRRHLTTSQRAIIAYKLVEKSKTLEPSGSVGSGNGKFSIFENLPEFKEETSKNEELTEQEASQIFKVNPKTIKFAQKVVTQGSPSIQKAVESGQIAVSDAANIVHESKQVQEQAVKAVIEGRAKNVTAAINARNRKQMAKNPPPLPTGQYRTIVIDPPWQIEKIPREVRPNQHGLDYPTMSVEEIGTIELPLAPDAFVFLWTTQKYLHDAFHILEQWNVNHRFTMVWHKPGGIQPYNYAQSNVEFILVGAKGNPLFIDLKSFYAGFKAPRAEHSVKPEEFYDVVRRVTIAPRLDMFSRRSIDGFDIWGNEVS